MFPSEEGEGQQSGVTIVSKIGKAERLPPVEAVSRRHNVKMSPPFVTPAGGQPEGVTGHNLEHVGRCSPASEESVCWIPKGLPDKAEAGPEGPRQPINVITEGLGASVSSLPPFGYESVERPSYSWPKTAPLLHELSFGTLNPFPLVVCPACPGPASPSQWTSSGLCWHSLSNAAGITGRDKGHIVGVSETMNVIGHSLSPGAAVILPAPLVVFPLRAPLPVVFPWLGVVKLSTPAVTPGATADARECVRGRSPASEEFGYQAPRGPPDKAKAGLGAPRQPANVVAEEVGVSALRLLVLLPQLDIITLSVLVVVPSATHDIVGQLVDTNVPHSRSFLVVQRSGSPVYRASYRPPNTVGTPRRSEMSTVDKSACMSTISCSPPSWVMSMLPVCPSVAAGPPIHGHPVSSVQSA